MLGGILFIIMDYKDWKKGYIFDIQKHLFWNTILILFGCLMIYIGLKWTKNMKKHP